MISFFNLLYYRYKNKVGYVPAVILNPQSEDIPLEDSMSLQVIGGLSFYNFFIV